MKKELHLVLIGKWYDMINHGIKKEEYRKIKPYWNKRLCDNNYDVVVFHRGYTNQIIKAKIKSISIGRGCIDLGAPINEDVFIIKFDKI